MFKVGDLLELNKKLNANQKRKIGAKYPGIAFHSDGVQCVVIDSSNSKCSTVVICRTKTENRLADEYNLCLRGTNHDLLLKTEKTYKIENRNFCISEDESFIDLDNAIKQIRLTRRRKKRIKKLVMNKKTYSDGIFEKYEIAILNNDRKKMQKITKKLGFTPVAKGVPGMKNCVQYKNMNVKPYQGGKFTPK